MITLATNQISQLHCHPLLNYSTISNQIKTIILLVCQGHYSRHALRGGVCISQADSSLTNWTALSRSEWLLCGTNLEREQRMSEENKTVNAMPIFQISNYISILKGQSCSIFHLSWKTGPSISWAYSVYPHIIQPHYYIFFYPLSIIKWDAFIQYQYMLGRLFLLTCAK